MLALVSKGGPDTAVRSPWRGASTPSAAFVLILASVAGGARAEPASPSAVPAPPSAVPASPAASSAPRPTAAVPVAPVDDPLSAVQPVTLQVALVDDPDLPALDDTLVNRALASASETFATRFDVTSPRFHVVARFSLDAFMKRYAKPTSVECAPTFSVRYRGGGRAELLQQKEAALRFFQRWPLEDLRTFVAPERRAAVVDYDTLHAAYLDKYLGTVAMLESLKTPAGTPLVEKVPADGRSHAAWSCALAAQRQFDVIVTNTFILADILTEPHPHAVFGKAKVGGLAGPSPGRTALGGQALVASTFSIDTPLPEISELGSEPVTPQERAEILGAFLLAHEIAHAVFGIPDVFDHPPGCLMTTRPGESYREALTGLRQHPGPCPRCRLYVEARAAYDRGRAQLGRGEGPEAVASLTQALRVMPSHFHGKKRRVAAVLTLAADGYAAMGDETKARRYAQLAIESDPSSEEARAVYARHIGKRPIEVVGGRRTIPEPKAVTKTATTARP